MPALVCKVCGNSVGYWGGFNGAGKGYWKHQVSRKLIMPHEPEPVKIAEYDMYYRRGQDTRNRRMEKIARGNKDAD